jgi:outer membrane protein X
MKKVISVFLLTLAVCLNGFAQKGEKAVGLNLGYGSEIKTIAIGAKFNYGITDQIRLSPSFNYFFEKDGLSGWEVNADVHYLFSVAPKISVYPLAGLTFTGWTFDWGGLFEDLGGVEIEGESNSNTETKLGLNIGGGIGYQLTNTIAIGLELKYSLVSDFDQLVPTINLTYKF